MTTAGKEYIERKAVFEMVDVLLDESATKSVRVAIYMLKRLLSEIPATDIAPVKHGEWTTIDGISRCSECGYIPLYDNAIDDLFYSDYCPNCGAKMEV